MVCANERDPALGRAYCGASEGSELRRWLKDRVRAEGLRGSVLALKTGCLGICSDFGVTVAIIPVGKPREIVVFPSECDREELWTTITGILQ
jgi:hypothetical protein